MAELSPNDYVQLAQTCDREPIHIPEKIQPRGVLLVLDGDGTVVAASDNVEGWFDPQPRLGQPLREFADPGLCALVERLSGAATIAVPIHRAATQRGVVPVHIHRGPQGHLILELWEDADDDTTEASMRRVHELTHDILATPTTSAGLEALFPDLVERVGQALGFDRVMLYRFHPDFSGEVIAEYRAKEMESFLNLRFPASDIPSQARALYVRQPLRFVHDARYEPVPLQSLLEEPLDMSGAILRSVSPMHCRYLANMGIRSSMSISIVVDGKLWGLIAHHGEEPHSVALALWPMLGLLSSVLSTKVHAVDLAERSQAQLHSAQVVQFLLARLNATSSLAAALVDGSPNIGDLIASTGTVISYDGKRSVVGEVPDAGPDLVHRLLQNPALRDASGVLAVSEGVPELVVTGTPGLLAIDFDDEPDHFIAWFRPEQVRTVNWAGDPEKPVELDEHGVPQLNPRNSFHVWSETVSGTAAPWSSMDLEAARSLRESLRDVLVRLSSLARR